MGYYMAGDYYAAGGIFGSIGRFVGGAIKTVGGLAPGPLGTVARTVGGAIQKASGGGSARAESLTIPTPMVIPTIVPSGGTVQKVPGVTGVVQRLIPGGATGYEVMGRRRKRMNVANPKALRRAIRREQGFVKLARKALRGTGYSVVSKGARRGRSVNIREAGSGSVVVR